MRIDELDLPLGTRSLTALTTHVWPAGATPCLYLRGELPTPTGIAIVGTRRATPEALAFTRDLVGDLAAAGFSIWSGAARGVDCAAHEAALAAHAPTVIVAPTGLDHPYPTEHEPLYQRAVDAGGALLSLWPDCATATHPRFLRRNRLLAALTAATVVVQAPLRSGARSTAASARALGRPLCVVPQPPWCPRGRGCIAELQAGAAPVGRARDVIAALQLSFAPYQRPPARRSSAPPSRYRLPAKGGESFPPTPAGDEARVADTAEGELASGLNGNESKRIDVLERAILEALSSSPTHLDVIVDAARRSPALVARALLTLTLRSVVVEGPAGYYRLTRRAAPFP